MGHLGLVTHAVKKKMKLNLDLILDTNQFQLIDVLNVKGKTVKLRRLM